jgi:hypothetical protein
MASSVTCHITISYIQKPNSFRTEDEVRISQISPKAAPGGITHYLRQSAAIAFLHPLSFGDWCGTHTFVFSICFGHLFGHNGRL